MITLKYLKTILEYEPISGIFIWKVKKRQNVYIGKVAGCICKTTGYRKIGIDGKHYNAHILAWFYMTGKYLPGKIDHENTIKDDNSWNNLRLANNSQNGANRLIQKNNTSGYKGVVWHKRDKKWQVQIKKDGNKMFFGYFDDPIEAAKIHDREAL